jgi:hypothetical protein
MALIAATVYDWSVIALMAASFSLVATFWYKLMQSGRNKHAWRRK